MNKPSNVIGEGTYGCVLKPSLHCSNKKLSYKNKISKIMLSKHAEKELSEYTIISKIDKKRDYFVGMPTKCKVKNTTTTIKSINKCKHLKKKYKNTQKNLKNMDLLIIEDGGVDLVNYSRNLMKSERTIENIRKNKKMWIEVHRLFRGIILFQKYNILHNDIKPQNIVFNEKMNRLNFIDFGIMKNSNTEIKKAKKSENWFYDYAFWNYPLEMQYLNKDVYIKLSERSIHEKNKLFSNLINDIKHNVDNEFVNSFKIFMEYITYNKSKDQELHIVNKYLSTFQKLVTEQIQKDKYEIFLKKSVNTIDVYGLGMALQYLLNNCKHLLTPIIIQSMETCFFNMTTPNLLQRYTIDEAIDAYETFLMDSEFLKDFGFTIENHSIVEKNIINNRKIKQQIKSIKSKDLTMSRENPYRINEI